MGMTITMGKNMGITTIMTKSMQVMVTIMARNMQVMIIIMARNMQVMVIIMARNMSIITNITGNMRGMSTIIIMRTKCLQAGGVRR